MKQPIPYFKKIITDTTKALRAQFGLPLHTNAFYLMLNSVVSSLLGFVFSIITIVYRRILKEELTGEAKQFIKNSLYVLVGAAFGALFMFIFNILAGRTLGPSGYGEFVLINSIALFLIVPLAPVTVAMVKYCSERDEYQGQSQVISTSFTLVLLLCAIFALAYFVFSAKLSAIFSVPQTFFNLSLLLFLFIIFHSFVTSSLYGLLEMKSVGLFQAIYGAILLSAFAFFVFVIKFISFEAAVFSMIIGYLIVTGIIFFMKRKYVSLKLHREVSSKLLRYSSYAVVGAICSVVTIQLGKILINKYMVAANVGIYNAYYVASIGVASFFMLPLAQVLFPTASRYKNKEDIFRRFNKVIPYIVVIGLPAIIFAQYVILALYGKEYPFDLRLAVLFGIASIVAALYLIYGRLMDSVGIKGVKVTSLATVVMALIIIPLTMVLIPLMGIEGAVVPLIIAYFVFCLFVLWKRDYFKSSD